MSVTYAHRAGLPVLRSISSYVHADANTPAERSGAYVTRFPDRDGLPRFDFGSASAIRVSRPAQRSLTFRPARSLSPQGTLFWKCFSPGRYLPEPLPVLPAGATEAGWDSHPLKIAALTRHTSKSKTAQYFIAGAIVAKSGQNSRCKNGHPKYRGAGIKGNAERGRGERGMQSAEGGSRNEV